MVCLRTGTMGVHPACFFIDRAGKVATPERNLAGKNSLYLAHPLHHRAPTGGRQAFSRTDPVSQPGPNRVGPDPERLVTCDRNLDDILRHAVLVIRPVRDPIGSGKQVLLDLVVPPGMPAHGRPSRLFPFNPDGLGPATGPG